MISDESNRTAYARLIQNDIWLKDLSLMCEWALSYKDEVEISKSFSSAVEYYAKILRHRADPETLTTDMDATLKFLRSLMKISQYGEKYDSSLQNTANMLSAAMLKALPNLKSQYLDAHNRTDLPRANRQVLSRD